MAKERCLKKSFKDSLEDIKERMMEKRNKKLAKVATVNLVKATKVKNKILNTSAVVMKNVQANNKALALALEEEKMKMREAQDIILHLKREYQALMFRTFLLQRKLSSQQASNSAESKLASLREIICKVTHSLLDTANLLGPAQDLCAIQANTRPGRPAVDERGCNLPAADILVLPSSIPDPASRVTVNDVANNAAVGKICPPAAESQLTSQNSNVKKILSRGQRSTHRSSLSVPENVHQNEGDDDGHGTLKNVNTRRRGSNVRSFSEDTSFVGGFSPPDPFTTGDLSRNYCEKQQIEAVPNFDDLCPENDIVESMAQDCCPLVDPPDMELSLAPLSTLVEIKSSTPQPRPKPAHVKPKELPVGRERGRKGKADGANIAPLRKPWENSRPRARSKSRERATGKQTAVGKEKMDISVCSNDAYDFFCEESVHVTPFRQGKVPEENTTLESQSSSSEQSDSDKDSLYVPHGEKAKNRRSIDAEQSSAAPLRPRSKRWSAMQQRALDEKENEKKAMTAPKSALSVSNAKNRKRVGTTNKTRNVPVDNSSVVGVNRPDPDYVMEIGEVETFISQHISKVTAIEDVHSPINVQKSFEEMASKLQKQELLLADEALGASATTRLGLRDLTNLSALSGRVEARKMSCPLLAVEDPEKLAIGSRKRRCTVSVNYKEPTLIGKLRRGDRFTDTEFLSSPIFKLKESKRKSHKKSSLSRYNEAFVGCR